MISVDELLKTWVQIRPFIPNEHGRLLAFAALVDMLLESGWDQDGYLRDKASMFPEVIKWCDISVL